MADQPIHFAAERGDLSEVQRIITEDPSLIEQEGEHDRTPLLIAAGKGHAAIVEWLLDNGSADIESQDAFGFTGLYLSSREGHLEVVSILFNRGVDINKATTDGSSPLMEAAWEGHVDVVELFLSQEGIDFDARTTNGYTALFGASIQGQEEPLRLLLEAGANPRIVNIDGQTPLDRARQGGHDECIRLLKVSVRWLLSPSTLHSSCPPCSPSLHLIMT